MLISSKYIILFLGGVQMLPSQPVVFILATTVPIIAMSNIFGVQLLIPFGYNKVFSRIIIASGLFYIILLLGCWITTGFTIINISVVTLLVEIFVTTSMFYYCKKYRLWK